MKRGFLFIAVALVTMAVAAVACADCGRGGNGGGKFKPEPIHDMWIGGNT